MDMRKGFQLGEWQIYPDQGLIKGQNGQEHLEPKVMDVLIYLAERSNEVVRRDALISGVWSGTFVTDEVLSRAISLLRSSLGDDSKSPSYIQTLPKLGYRLLMPVLSLEEPVKSLAVLAPESNPQNKSRVIQLHTRIIRLHTRVIRIMVASSLAITLIIIGFVFWINHKAAIDPASPAAYANISEWFDYLSGVNAGNKGIAAIAVLPFTSLTEDKDSKNFSDGLTDDLTTSLSKVKGLKVVARRSSYSFKNRIEDIPTVGKLLNVNVILEGSVRRSLDHLRVSAQLSDAANGYILWSETYDAGSSDVYHIQQKLSANLVKVLGSHFNEVTMEVPETPSVEPDLEAYKLYLMNGKFLWNLRGEKPLRESINQYRKALAIDPNFSRAAIGLASSLVLLPFYSSEPMEPTFQQVTDLLAKYQFSNNSELGEAEAIYAFIAQQRWHWVEAEERYRKALKLAPNNPNTFMWYSEHLGQVGRQKDSLEAARRAYELDNVSPVINDRLAVGYLWLNENRLAEEHFKLGRQLGFSNANNPAYIINVLRQKRYNEFKSLIEVLHRGTPNKPQWIIEHADKITRPEHSNMAVAMATQAEHESKLPIPTLMFGMWILIGGLDQAYATFNTFKTHAPQFLQPEFIFSQEARTFRADPRFKELVNDIGWQKYWDTYGGPDTNLLAVN